MTERTELTRGETALIGHTGFVGGNLARQREFDALFNSSNVGEIAGREFDTVVMAAARAEKWRINQDPESDLAHIAELEGILSSVTARRLVLISTVDVYRVPIGVYEDTPVEVEGLHPYGLHRYRLEEFARSRFAETTVVRLPGLFGAGLKKNVIFDLLHDNNVDRIHHAGSFQYYNLAHLADDLDVTLAAGLPLLNAATAPLRTDEIARRCFGFDFTNVPEGHAAGSYDLRTRYAADFGNTGDYLYSREQVLAELAEFVEQQRNGEAR